MKTIKKLLVSAIAVLTMSTACVLTAAAEETYDINDVADALRAACVPEGQIQLMMNAYQQCEKDEYGVYAGGDYYRYDELVWTIEGFGASINDVIAAELSKPENQKLYEEMMATATTTTVTTAGNGTGSSTSTTTTTTAKTFEQMTMDEKIVYLYSMPEAERKAFINNLSVDEKQSVLAQMATDNQAAVLDQLKQIMEGMGFHMTVDNMQQGQVDVSIRDNEGNLVDSSSMGVTVEDTGWNLTGWFALASALVLVAIGGVCYVMYRTARTDEEEQNG